MTYMTDEERDYYERTRKPLFKMPRSRFGKLLLGLGIAMWFMILMLPCGLLYLATSGNITIAHANIPDPESHPLFSIQLIMEQDNRGFQFTRSTIFSESGSNLCVQTSVNYLLWETDQDETSAIFCDCYTDDSVDAEMRSWILTSTNSQACE